MTRPYAAFDIDGTIIRWQLYHALNDALARQGLIDGQAFAKVRNARMSWKKRTDDDAFHDYETAMVRVFDNHLSKLALKDVQDIANEVIAEYKDQVYTYTRDLIHALKSKDYLLFAVSGSPKLITEPLARYYGFDDVVATTYPVNNGVFTGDKYLSLGRKPELLQELINKYGADQKGSIAVGDSSGDAGMLEMVEQPIAFNPDKKLFQQAKQQGWKIVIERKNMIYQMENRDGSYLLV